ncbi:hypothetical protein HNR33_000233 [Brassicibacter mesophilus]|jgi:hypothetical protein
MDGLVIVLGVLLYIGVEFISKDEKKVYKNR